MSDQDSTFVNTLLSPEQLAELEAIKSWHGLQNRSETIRFLIRHEARRIYTEPTPIIPQNANTEVAP